MQSARGFTKVHTANEAHRLAHRLSLRSRQTRAVESGRRARIGGPGRRGPAPDDEALRLVAAERRARPTRAERALAAILLGLNGGALDGRFRREWVCGGRWIVDFYFPEVGLGIEVDGGYHRSRMQRSRDLLKAAELEAAGVSLLRLTNEEIFAGRERLVAKLRRAWGEARRNRAPREGR